MERERSSSGPILGVALVDLLVVIAALTLLAVLFINIANRARFKRRLGALRRRSARLASNPNTTRAMCEALNDDIRAFNNEFAEDLPTELPLVDCSRFE